MSATVRRTVSGLVVFATMVYMGYYLYLSNNPGVNYRSLRHFWNSMGFLSIFLGLAAVGLWWTKRNLLGNAKSGAPVFGSTVLMLRQSHMVFGWLSFLLGLGHSVYYLLANDVRLKFIGTGIVATIVMVLMIYTGIMYHYRALNIPIVRRIHLILSMMLAVILLLHM